jgi:predicted Zn-dependent peptidase
MQKEIKRSSRHYQCTYRRNHKTSKDAFNEEVDFLGANIDFDASGASASGLSKYSERILELMADGALNTVYQEEFDKIQAKLRRNQNTRKKCRCSCWAS